MDTTTATTTTAPLTIRERQIHILVMENPGYPAMTSDAAAYDRLVTLGHVIRRGEGYWPNYGDEVRYQAEQGAPPEVLDRLAAIAEVDPEDIRPDLY